MLLLEHPWLELHRHPFALEISKEELARSNQYTGTDGQLGWPGLGYTAAL